MDILLLAAETMISHTLQRMLESHSDWNVSRWFCPDIDRIGQENKADSFDGIIVNLPDFVNFYILVIHKIRRQFPDLPLLALSNYSDDFLIEPLLSAGADGYLQLGQSDAALRKAIETILSGEQCIITENT